MYLAIVDPSPSAKIGMVFPALNEARVPGRISTDGTTLVIEDDTLVWFDKWFMFNADGTLMWFDKWYEFIAEADGHLHQAAIS